MPLVVVALVVAVVVVVMVGVLEVDVAVVVALAGTVRKYSENALFGNARERSDMFGKIRKSSDKFENHSNNNKNLHNSWWLVQNHLIAYVATLCAGSHL